MHGIHYITTILVVQVIIMDLGKIMVLVVVMPEMALESDQSLVRVVLVEKKGGGWKNQK